MRPSALIARVPRVRAAHDEVHVWAFLLEDVEEARVQCERLLSADELARGRRFHHQHHQVAFIFAHGLMRHLLGAYCESDPAGLEFAAGEFGKPSLVSKQVSFNLSHSHGRALLAVSVGREVGVDIERENARTDALGIASSYFHGSELDAIRDAPADLRTVTFFRFWAAKEAVIKAQGSGLYAPLDSFHVRFGDDRATAHVDVLDESRVSKGWFVRRLGCEPGWHAAVAASSDGWRLRVMHEA